MAQAKQGDTVKVHYTGTLDDGTVFDSSAEKEPLEFTIGQGQLIPGFEEAVTGLNISDSTKVTIPADQAYGLHQKELIIEVDKSQFPDNAEPAIGQQFHLEQSGQQFVVTVIETSESVITLDANHPLAGKNLTFAIELVEIA